MASINSVSDVAIDVQSDMLDIAMKSVVAAGFSRHDIAERFDIKHNSVDSDGQAVIPHNPDLRAEWIAKQIILEKEREDPAFKRGLAAFVEKDVDAHPQETLSKYLPDSPYTHDLLYAPRNEDGKSSWAQSVWREAVRDMMISSEVERGRVEVVAAGLPETEGQALIGRNASSMSSFVPTPDPMLAAASLYSLREIENQVAALQRDMEISPHEISGNGSRALMARFAYVDAHKLLGIASPSETANPVAGRVDDLADGALLRLDIVREGMGWVAPRLSEETKNFIGMDPDRPSGFDALLSRARQGELHRDSEIQSSRSADIVNSPDRPLNPNNFDAVRRHHIEEGGYMPGDTLTIRPSGRFVNDVDEHKHIVKFLDDKVAKDGPLEVKQIVLEDVGAGRYKSYATFKGIGGLYSVDALQDARGEEPFFGVVAERNGRMFAVPMETFGNDQTLIVGEAREISGIDGNYMRSLNPGGFSSFKERLLEDGPVSGEFTVAPAPDGKVVVLANPWTSQVSKEEADLADKAIERIQDPEAGKRAQVVNAHFAAMIHGQGR